ncbi:MAG: hypothetical protein ABI155_10685 [Paralcaligenes sp.]
MLTIGLSSATARADGRLFNGLLQIEAAGFAWSEPQEVKVFEVPVYLRSFTAAVPVEKAAQILARNTKFFHETLASRQKIILSGTRPDSHWVAEINATSEGAQGLVSALSLDPGRLNKALSLRSGLEASWVPQPARLHFSQMSVVHGQVLRQQIYRVGHLRDEMETQLHTRLKALGWRDVSTEEWPSVGRVWRLGRQRLVLVSAAAAGESTLFVQHFQ